MTFREKLIEFCQREGEKLSYRLSVPLVHNRISYDSLVWEPEGDCPVVRDSTDGWMADLSCLNDEECREILIQVCKERYGMVTERKEAIVQNIGLESYVKELRYIQDCIEEATVYA